MPNETLQDLKEQKDILAAQVFPLQSDGGLASKVGEKLSKNPPCVDPDLASALESLFQKQPCGKLEYLRMEIDLLRRVMSSRETEQIFRAFGVLYLATPVRLQGKVVHALFSGPIKISPWTQQEKATLAALCGISVQDLPKMLDQSAIYSPAQIDMLVRFQKQTAALWQCALSQTATAPETSSQSTSIGMDLLQPGFADHLDLLFTSIQREIKHPETLQGEGKARLQTVSQRGRHLAGQIRQLSQNTFSSTQQVSVHHILEKWVEHFAKQQPTLSINLRLEAKQPQVEANVHHLEHMLFTLMASIADGLPEGRAVMGLSTRNALNDAGEECLHLEIRDGGGLATFAGIGGETDARVLLEQNEAADEFLDWFSLASRMDAELRVLKDNSVVSRAELYLPLRAANSPSASENIAGIHRLWIIEDDDREFESLNHMLNAAGFICERFTSAADLRNKFALSMHSPDMVILKYHLPDQRGAEVRSWLYEQDSSLPVILISGLQATHPGIATANSLPSTLYLQKPFDSQSLLDMVRMNLDDTLPG